MGAIYQPIRGTGLLLMLAAMGGFLSSPARAADPQSGSWQPHKMTLHFLGVDSAYSCDGLKTALTYLLHQVGAKLNAPIVPQPCINGYGTPERLSEAELNFSALQPAAADSAEGVSGTWRHVEISSQQAPLHGANCELVSEFQEDVLKYFALRNVKARLNCVPFQDTSLVYALSFDVFAPVSVPPEVGGNTAVPAQRAVRAAGA